MKPERKLPFDVLDAQFVGALTHDGDISTLPVTGMEIAFAGRSNVGKSTLINTLVRRRGLVRTSSTPGCTRQINFFSSRARDGAELVLVDLPGYGFAKRSKTERSEWATLIEGYLASRATLRAVVLLCDARRGLEEEELELVDFLLRGRKKGLTPVAVVLVATKLDKVPRSERAARTAKLAAALAAPGERDTTRGPDRAKQRIVGFSSEEGIGYEELWREIRRATGLLVDPGQQSGHNASTDLADGRGSTEG